MRSRHLRQTSNSFRLPGNRKDRMLVADDFENLKRQVAEEERLQAEAQGSYNQMRKVLRSKFGVKTLKQAKRLAKKKLDVVHDTADRYVKDKKAYAILFAKAKKARARANRESSEDS